MLPVLKMRHYKQIKKEDKLYFWSFIKKSWLRPTHGFWQSVVRITLLLVLRKLLQRFFSCFLFFDCLNSNNLKSRIEHGVWTFFRAIICSVETETMWVTNYTTRFGAKNVQKTKFEAAEMILDLWNQQLWELFQHMLATQRKLRSLENCCL